MIAEANSSKLAQGLKNHLKETEGHLKRLDEVFKLLGEQPSGEVCMGIKGILAEGAKLLKLNKGSVPRAFDAALIAACQRVEHYEIAGYGCARSFCQQLGEIQCMQLLQATLDEEGRANQGLTELAVSEINLQALGTASA